MISLNDSKKKDNNEGLKDLKVYENVHIQIQKLKIEYDQKTLRDCVSLIVSLCLRLNSLTNKLIKDDSDKLVQKINMLMDYIENIEINDHQIEDTSKFKKIDLETYNALAYMADFSLQESEIDNVDEKIKNMVLRFKKQAEGLKKQSEN